MLGLNKEELRRHGGASSEESLHHLTEQIIGCAMRVHSALGPGLLESAYEECLCHALAKARLPFRRQVAMPIEFEGLKLDCGFRLDLLVDDRVVIEVKSAAKVLPVHFCQLLTYLRLSRVSIGLILNFNVVHLRDGISRRRVLST